MVELYAVNALDCYHFPLHVCFHFVSYLFSLYSSLIVEDLIDPTVSSVSSTANTVVLQRLVKLTSLIPSTMIQDSSNEDNLRICINCEYILQKYHNQIRYKHIPIDEIFFLYEVNLITYIFLLKNTKMNIFQKIPHAEKQYKSIQSKYTTIIESLL